MTALIFDAYIKSAAKKTESIETAGDIPARMANQFNAIYVEAVDIAFHKQQRTVQTTSNLLNMTRKFIG